MSLRPQSRLTDPAAEEIMTIQVRLWRCLVIPVYLAAMLSISSAAELNPAAVIYKLPDQIPWSPVNVLLIMGEGPATATAAEEK
jgi:hypothetical protein